MGSLFTTSKEAKIKTTFGRGKLIPFYLQFVPGIVVEVITKGSSSGHPGMTNSILALPHISEGLKTKRSQMTEKNRYFPLLRGIFEVPTKGDPILLCTIGGNQYYLGPLNTDNDANFNEDNLFIPEPSNFNLMETDNLTNESINFVKMKLNRFEKEYVRELDGPAIEETHGDIMLEGRHGNSFRIGSRSENPYVFISNKRARTQNTHESLYDGGLISITSKGSLKQHFGQVTLPPQHSGPWMKAGGGGKEAQILPMEKGREVIDYKLSSDFSNQDEEPPIRTMEKIISSVNGNQDGKQLIYDYSDNQVFISSDRITLNSRKDDIYLSTLKDIHIGAKRHLTISTNKNLIIESEKTYLGNPNKEENEGNMEPMVFGNLLIEVLTETLTALKEAQGLCTGAPIPLVDSTMAPLSVKVTQIEQKLNGILSNKHFVEPN